MRGSEGRGGWTYARDVDDMVHGRPSVLLPVDPLESLLRLGLGREEEVVVGGSSVVGGPVLDHSGEALGEEGLPDVPGEREGGC